MLRVGYVSILCGILVATPAGLSIADQVAATINGATGTVGGYPVGGSVHGWSFKPTVDILVTHLGLYDYVEPFEVVPVGLRESQWVGIFSLDETLLTHETLPAGTQLQLVSQFRYSEIQPLLLLHQQTYVVAAGGSTGDLSTGNRMWSNFTSPPVFASEIQYLQGLFDSHQGQVFPFPHQTLGTDPYQFGPNFQFQIVSEPSTAVLVMLGAVSLMVMRLRNATAC